MMAVFCAAEIYPWAIEAAQVNRRIMAHQYPVDPVRFPVRWGFPVG